jgi:hypothetical protein
VEGDLVLGAVGCWCWVDDGQLGWVDRDWPVESLNEVGRGGLSEVFWWMPFDGRSI